MIFLITGQIGSGKSLYCLPFVKKLSEEETPPRQVYYSGINHLNREVLPWIDLNVGVDLNPAAEAENDKKEAELAASEGQAYVPWFRGGQYPNRAQGPRDWWKLPVGSIIVIDECQEHFPPRGSGSVQPLYIELFARSRHRGYDIVLITQGPTMFDSFIRALINRHFHVVRNFGLKKATIHEWHKICVNPDSVASKRMGVRHEFFYPKEVFGWYESSKKHTHKAQVPMKVFLLPVVVLVAICAAVIAYRSLMANMHPKGKTGDRVAAGVVPGANQSGPRAPGPSYISTKDYLEIRKPRVAGLPYTAPVYDRVTAVVEAPYPAACVEIHGDCRCYSQRGTILDTSPDLCRGIVKHGFFADWLQKDGAQVKKSDDKGDGSRQSATVAMAGASTNAGQ